MKINSHNHRPFHFATLASAVLAMALAAPSVQAQNFTSGNLAVALAASATANNTTVSIVELSPSTANQSSPVQTVSVDGGSYRVSGSGTSSLYMANSADGSLVAFTVHKSANTSANANTLTSRGVLTLNNAKTLSNPASYTGSSGNQTRGASSLNNSGWFIGDQNGFYTDGSTSASPSANIRSVKAFGSTVYAFTALTNAPPVGLISATSGGTYTALSGLANGSTTRQDFYMISSAGNSTFDILYVLDATSATAGTIYKYSLVSGSWTANGTYTTSFGGFGLCAKKNGSGADLFVTTGTGATAANSVIKLTDTAGYNSTISITTGNNVTLYTAASGTTLKGIAFAPVAASTPTITGAATAAAFTTTYGTASTAQTFTVGGSNLSASITATAPTGFEVSSDGTTYGGTATFSQTSGSASGTLYARLKSTAVPGGTYNSQTIVLSSTGASSVNISTASSGNSVSTKALTITGLTGVNKTYDGLTTASATGTAAVSGLVGSDTVTLGGTAAYAFSSAAVGTSKSITTTGYTITGGQSSYYSLTQPTLSADITQRALSITANNVNKVAGNALTGGAGSTAFTSSGLQNGETVGTVTITYGTGALAGDAAGTYSGQVTPSAAAGGTFTASNYNISYVSGDIIVSATPTISAPGSLSAVSTTYGTATASPTSISVSGGNLTGNLSVAVPSGFEVSSDGANYSAGPLALAASSGTVSSTTIYVRLPATASVASSPYSGNLTISGGGATTVNIAIPSSTVTARGLTITGISITNKVYDGTVSATITGTASYSGLVNGDSFSVTGSPSASFGSKTVASGKSVTVSGYTAPNSNYSIAQPTGLTANITAKELTVTSAAVTAKTYDGTAAAAITGTLTGVISGDTVTLNGTGTFASAGAGTGISVTSTSTLGGADAGNYSLTQPTGLSGTINTKSLTITANNVSKGFGDTLTGGAGSTAFTSSGLVGSETIGSVTISYGTGAASSAAIGAYNGSVTASAATGGTFDSLNYSITYVAGNITVTGFTAGNLVVARYGDGTTTLGSAAAPLTVLEINPTAGTTTQTLSSVATGANLLTDSGTATSDGYLSSYGALLALPGYNTASGVAGVATSNTKAVNVLGTAATVLARVLFPTSGTPLPFSANNFRSVIPTDTGKFYASGNGGSSSGGIWYYNGSTFTQISTTIVNTRNVEIYNGNLYFSTGSGTTGIYQVGSGLPTTSGQTANLVMAVTSPYGFAISPDGNTAYVADDGTVSGNTGGGIQKWTKSGSTWTRQYTFGTQARGLTVDFSGANPVIYATTIEASNNKIIKITDTGSSATSSDVASAGANYVFRGVDFSPAAAPTISTSGTLSSLSTTYGTASSSTSFSVSGSNMIAGILVTPPPGFEVSTDNSAFSGTVTVGSSGTISSTTVYVRLVATASAGNKSGNIVLTSSGAADVNLATVASTVSQKGVTISGLSGVNKVYDGSTTATTSGTASYSGLVNGESFSVTGTPVATFANANVGTSKVVTITGYSAPSANYSLTDPTVSADITAKGLTISGISIANKTYDGTTAATITGTAAYFGLVGSESFAIAGTPSAVFLSAAAGNTKSVTVSGYAAPNSNYSITQPTGLTANITAVSLGSGDITITPVGDGSFTASATGVSGFSYSYSGRTANGIATSYSSSTAPTAAGFYTVTATSTDGNYSGSNSSGFHIHGAVAVNDAVTKPADNSRIKIPTSTLLGNDSRIHSDGSVLTDNLAITAVSQGTGTAASLSGAFVLFTPSSAGSDSFTYTVTDSISGKTATGTVTVTTEATAPTFTLQIVGMGTATFDGTQTSVTMGFLGVPGQTYEILYKGELNEANWTSAGSVPTGTGPFSVTITRSGNYEADWNGSMFFQARINP